METAPYYTFSTIAQALAAAIALLAAFAMYRFRDFRRELVFQAEKLRSSYSPSNSEVIIEHIHASAWRPVLDAFNEQENASNGVVDYSTRIRKRLRTSIASIRAVERALWVSVAATALVIVGSVAVLAYVPSICSNGHASAFLNSGVAATTLCAGTYGWLLISAFRSGA